jgi:hypothetical protein
VTQLGIILENDEKRMRYALVVLFLLLALGFGQRLTAPGGKWTCASGLRGCTAKCFFKIDKAEKNSCRKECRAQLCTFEAKPSP